MQQSTLTAAALLHLRLAWGVGGGGGVVGDITFLFTVKIE